MLSKILENFCEVSTLRLFIFSSHINCAFENLRFINLRHSISRVTLVLSNVVCKNNSQAINTLHTKDRKAYRDWNIFKWEWLKLNKDLRQAINLFRRDEYLIENILCKFQRQVSANNLIENSPIFFRSSSCLSFVFICERSISSTTNMGKILYMQSVFRR